MPTVWSGTLALNHCRHSDLFPSLDKWLRVERRAPDSPELSPDMSWSCAATGTTVDTAPDPDSELNWAFRLTQPSEAVLWTTEVLFLASNRDHPELLVDLIVRGRDNRSVNVSSLRLFPPSFLTDIITQYGRHPEILQPRSFLTQQELPDYLELLQSPDRPLPVLAVSELNDDRTTLLNLDSLARRTRATAQVVRVGKDISFLFPGAVKKEVGGDRERANLWNVYNGATRVYQRDLDFSGLPFDHKLWLARQIRANHIGFEDEAFTWLAFNSTLRAPERPGSVSLFRGIRRSTADFDDLVRSYDADLLAMRRLQAEARDEHAQSVRVLEAKIAYLENRLTQIQAPIAVGAPADAADTVPLAIVYPSHSASRSRPALDFVDSLQAEKNFVITELTRLGEYLQEPSNPKITVGICGNPDLTEFRVNTKDHWLRFFLHRPKRSNEVWVLHGYKKKQNDLDPKELDRAAAFLKELRGRQ